MGDVDAADAAGEPSQSEQFFSHMHAEASSCKNVPSLNGEAFPA
jgi:hypothetical protein